MTEKIWTVLGQEFGEDYGRKTIVVRALYGLNSAGDAFRNHLADYMHYLVFLPYTSNLDLLMKPMVRLEYGFECYAYVLIYVGDAMVIHNDAEGVLWQINKYFKLKPSSIGNPDIYLEAKFPI